MNPAKRRVFYCPGQTARGSPTFQPFIKHETPESSQLARVSTTTPTDPRGSRYVKDSKTRVEIHPLRGFKMETISNKALVHYIGLALLLASAAFFIKAIAPNGFF